MTTIEELEGYAIVKGILRRLEGFDTSRVTYKDGINHFSILLDGNFLKVICKLYFNRSQKYIGFYKNKKEEKFPIDSIDDLFNFSEQLKEKINELLALQVK